MTNPLYIPDGIASVIKEESPDSDVFEFLSERINTLKKNYENESFSLLSWSKLDRSALHVGVVNQKFSKQFRDRMLSDLEVCDDVILSLTDILGFSFSVQKLHLLIARIEKFVNNLSDNSKAGFSDILGVLAKWAEDGVPESLTENDKVLLSSFEKAKTHIPEEVNVKHHKAFIIDRLKRLEKIRLQS